MNRKLSLEEVKSKVAIIEAAENEKLFKYRQELERVQGCIKLNLCPECGANLIREDKEILDKPIKFLGIVFSRTAEWDFRKVCSVNKQHYEDKYDYDGDLHYF